MKLERRTAIAVAALSALALCAGCAHTVHGTAADRGEAPSVAEPAEEAGAAPQDGGAEDAARPAVAGQAQAVSEAGDDEFAADEFEEEPEAPPIADPFEKLNRMAFAVNDKLYFWIAKPVAVGYSKVMPQKARVGVRNFFSNVATPIRLVNCLLQAKWRGAGTEAARFGINTTVGVLGFGDPAAKKWSIRRQDEDLGQTLGKYGIGQGFYINWLVLGPSSPRDTAGLIGDSYLDPVNYLEEWETRLAIKVYDGENDLSLRIGDYEDLKRSAFDPYVALKHAYIQHRQYKVEDRQ